MASNTPNLGLYKKDPATDGNDSFNITTMLNENWDKIDAGAAKAPASLKSVSYDAVNDRIPCVLGPIVAELFNGDTKIIVEKTVDTTYYIDAPAINTTYYLYLGSDGNYMHNTTGVTPPGAVLLWQIATGATKDTITYTDKRVQISSATDQIAAHKADTMPHKFVSGGVTYRWGLAVIDGVVNMVYEEVV